MTRYTNVTKHYDIERVGTGKTYNVVCAETGKPRFKGFPTAEAATARAIQLEQVEHSPEATARREQEAAKAAAEQAAKQQAHQEAEARANLATPRQIGYIQHLIEHGEPGYMAIPEDLTQITRGHASMLIDSLKGNY